MARGDSAMILFQLQFEVAPERQPAFETAFGEIFLPALRKQKGFVSARFVRLYAPAQSAEIKAAPTEFNYQVVFTFESEGHRRVWAASPDHDVAWPAFSSLARNFTWRGFDVLASA
jgi:heme-degrading monooxygenase HmoA